MIVDVHVHAPRQIETSEQAELSPAGYRGDRQYKRNVGLEEFQEAMAPVDKCICVGTSLPGMANSQAAANARAGAAILSAAEIDELVAIIDG